MKITTQIRLAVLLVAASVSIQKAAAQSITIQSATATANQSVLTISGANYCASPAVTLGGTTLSVTSATSTMITATLPPMSPSTYYLVVSCGTLAGRTAYFDVTIGAAQATTTAAGACAALSQRYADCGNGTITDSMTGLIWLKDAACPSLGTPNFSAATTAASSLHSGQCGLTDGSNAGDWRLPTRAEWLATLVGPQRLIAQFAASTCATPPLRSNDGVTCYSAATAGPATNQHAFLNVVTGGYWTSSTYELDPSYVYLADLSVTRVNDDNTTLPHFPVAGLSLNVWPVRGGSK